MARTFAYVLDRNTEKLKISQLTQVSCPQEGYIYTENVSKNRSGGFAQLSMEHKIVPVYASTAGPELAL